MMDNRFEPKAIEARIAARWEEAEAFKALRPGKEQAVPFSIVIPPPNVTGSLHIGHALNHTLQDVLCRYWRLRGRDVLWQPGTDHAGIATQMMVERKLKAENRPGRRELGRDAFLREVWAWKEQSGRTIQGQLKRLGASCDWSRERFTMDPGLSAAVLKVFVDLHRQGLIYKDQRLVNWDPALMTAISDLEVDPREVKGQMWHLDYPLADDPSVVITVGTTRPETMLGDTAVAVHPDDPRWQHLIGRHVRLPLVGRLIPIIADTYSDPEKGSGAVKITPAHDFNDFEVGKRHDLPLINIFTADGRITVRDNARMRVGVPDGDLPADLLALEGLDRFEARKRVVAWFETQGLLNRVEPNAHAVPHGDRSGVPIEPFLTEQWYCNVQPLAERAMAAVRDGRTRLHPPEREKIFFHWMENIEPWCISRQLWWGHRIPAWYGPVLAAGTAEPVYPPDVPGHWQIFVETDEASVLAHAERFYGRPVRVVADRDAAISAAEADDGTIHLWRDPDVLDTWFSSALWPFSTMGWPQQTAELARFYPTSTLVTGADILFFWVARMMMMGLNFLDDVPFHDVILHGLVRDEKGKKMSKTTGNVIDPLDVIERYGADALRFTLTAMTSGGRDLKLSLARVEGYRNFATKLWNATRFAQMNGCLRAPDFDPDAAQQPLNRWVLGEVSQAMADVAGAIEAYRFNDAADAAYRFVWGTFCDWYLELAKPVLQSQSDAQTDVLARAEAQATTAHVLDQICLMLQPFMPFITEEIWQATGGEGLLCQAAWPETMFRDAQAEAELGFVVDLISEIRSVRAETSVPGGAMVDLVMVRATEPTRALVARWDATIRRLARAGTIRFADMAPGQAAQVLVRGETIALPLGDLIDIAAERQRLQREADKLAAEISAVERKLGNPDFMARAPEDVIEENRERIAAANARLSRIAQALARLE